MKIKSTDTMKTEGGAAYVEFLLAFIPLFFFFLGMVQMCLMYAGDLVVQHAASRASRAASVVIDDDPRYYGGEDRRTVSSTASGSAGGLGAIIALFTGAGGAAFGGSPSRLDAIRMAASMPLASISPSARQFSSPNTESIRQAIDDPDSRSATGVFMYNDAAMEVTFPNGPGSSSERSSWGHGDQVTTRVVYSFHCGIPLVNRMMCRDRGPAGIGGVGAFFKTLRGEATMPVMSARYEYQ